MLVCSTCPFLAICLLIYEGIGVWYLLCLRPPSSSSPLPNVNGKNLDLEVSSFPRCKAKFLLIMKCPSCGICYSSTGRPRLQLPLTVLTHRLSPWLGGLTQSGERAKVEECVSLSPLFFGLPAFWAKMIPSATNMVLMGVVGLDKEKKSSDARVSVLPMPTGSGKHTTPPKSGMASSCHSPHWEASEQDSREGPRGNSHLSPVLNTEALSRSLGSVSLHSTGEIHLPGALALPTQYLICINLPVMWETSV